MASQSPLPSRAKVTKHMTFMEGLVDIIAGKKITKLEWEDPGTYVFLHNESLCIHHSKEGTDIHHSLIVSKGDLMGEDWVLVEEKN